MDGLSGLYVTGDAATATPSMKSAWQEDDLSFLKSALEMDVPVLATGLGLGLLNQAFGGKPVAPVSGHGAGHGESNGAIVTHTIYLSPGSKSAAILGVGGFFKVTSHHVEGLREPQRSPRLLASAYAVEDGVIEGLESVEHRWVIGFQATIEREGEAPRVFGNVVQAFVERARAFAAGEASRGRL
jgi:putative glutamine amidotransferase